MVCGQFEMYSCWGPTNYVLTYALHVPLPKIHAVGSFQGPNHVYHTHTNTPIAWIYATHALVLESIVLEILFSDRFYTNINRNNLISSG